MPASDVANNPRAHLEARLRSLGRALMLVRVARGALLWLAGGALVFAAVILALAHLSPLATAALALVRSALPVALVILAAATAWQCARPLSIRALARMVEARYPDLQDRLLAVVNPAPAAAPLVSAQLAGALAAQVSERLARERLHTLANWRVLRPLLFGVAVAGLTAFLIAGTCPHGLARLLAVPALPAQAPERRLPQKSPAPDLTRVGLYDVALGIAPPEYTGLPSRHLTESLERVEVIKGTRLTVTARQSVGARVTLRLGSARPVELRPIGQRISHSFVARRELVWTLAACLGAKRASAGPFRIIVRPDAAPRVRILEPGRDLTLSSAPLLRLVVQAEDDFGLSEVSLLYRRAGQRAWSALSLGSGQRELSYASQWDLTPLALRPGEALEYRVRARDNDAVSGPKTSLTPTYTVSIARTKPATPTPQAVEKAQQQEQDALAELQAEAQAFSQQLEDLIARAHEAELQGKSSDFSRAALEEAAERLNAHAADLRQAMSAVEKSLSENPLVSDDLAQKVKELHQLLTELMDKDMKRILEKVQEALRQRMPEQVRISLEQAREAQQRFMEKLERTVALLRKAKLEAQLEALKRHVQQLADKQQKLKEETDQLAQGQRSEAQVQQQAQLATQTEPLPALVRDAAEQMEAENQQIAAELRNLAVDLEQQDPSGQMRRAVGALERGKPRNAQLPQTRALRSLRGAAARLAGAAADLTAQDRSAMTQAAQQLARDALKLSTVQEQALEKARQLLREGPTDPQIQKSRLTEIKRAQEAVERGLAGLSSRMRKLSSRTPLMDPTLVQRAEGLSQGMSDAARSLEAANVPRAVGRQTEAMRGLNDLARDLVSLSDQLSKASAQMALQEYLKRLEELAERQQLLNQRTGADQQGGQPGGATSDTQPVPGTGELGQLAFEQALIRQALEKLLGGKDAGRLVDQLGGVPAEMKKVEDAMRGQDLGAETRQRQRDILHKMLDAQRSLYSKQKQSRERKAEAPRPYKPPRAPPVLRPEQTRPPRVERRRGAPGEGDLPLGFEGVTREYLEKVRAEGRR